MNETNNELNDIILNKNNGEFSGFKKVLLGVATFAVLLIIVVVVMSTLSDSDTSISKNLKENKTPKVLPPEPNGVTPTNPALFKDAVITTDEVVEAAPLDLEIDVAPEETPVKADTNVTVATPTPTVIKDPYTTVQSDPIVITPVTTTPKETIVTQTNTRQRYVQVGSFQKAKPNKKLLKKITDNGYTYTLKRVSVRGKMVTKLLIGPYNSYREANNAKAAISDKINADAFIY